MRSNLRITADFLKIKFFFIFLGLFSFIAITKASQPINNSLPILNGGDWVKYFAKPGNVEIYFPVQYDNNFKETSEGKVTTVTAKDGSTDYLLIWTILKDNAPTGYEASKTAMLKFKDAHKGEIKEEDKFKSKKCEGVEATILIPSQSLTVNYKVIIVNKIMYQIAVISPTATINKKDVSKFMKSFEITN